MTATVLTTTTVLADTNQAGTVLAGTDRSAVSAAALLDAGAVLPAGTLPDAGRPDSAADVLTARTYAHPALDGRRIVRLVPGALGQAEDAALDFLGLTPDHAPAEVGQVRQEALGFPAWALVNDPANGHHALALVKEMERLARQVKSKPGAAKDGFSALATRLGRAVPHFLPTYCEEVGRIFLAQGNQTYAAAWFGKAREAERTHGLAVDEERLRTVFLEFALAGALTVKALRQYVKELSKRLDPLTAWHRFRQLCTERSAAGMAPYAGVAEDARSLIRAAGIDRTENEQALLAELLDSPAVNRAPAAFWKSWHDRLVELGLREPAVRARLLELLPESDGGDAAERDAAWLALLAETGAEAQLTGPRAEGAEPAAAWLATWCRHVRRGWPTRTNCPATLALVGRMTQRLIDDATPVDLFLGLRVDFHHLDLLDALLAAGVPVADPPADLGLGVKYWAEKGDDTGAPLTAIAADPRYRPLLRAAAPAAWEIAVVRESPAVPLLRELFVEWAEERADELDATRGLAAAADLVRSLDAHRTTIRTIAPAAGERIASLDVAGLLAGALTAGILDELGWPALEEALATLADPAEPTTEDTAEPTTEPAAESTATGAAKTPGFGGLLLNGLNIEDAWPHLVLSRKGRALVVGPQGLVLDHTLRVPKLDAHWNRPRMRFVDGELLVAWQEDDKQVGYWSSRPDERIEIGGATIAGYHYGDVHPERTSLPLPGGGRSFGERPLHPGDTRLPEEHRLLGDGTGHWTLRHHNGAYGLYELDARTGAVGRASEPPAFAANAQDGRLAGESTRLLPLQPGLEGTPLGTDGTVLGHWVRIAAGRAATTVTAAGQRIALPITGERPDNVAVGRLALPGEASPVVLGTSGLNTCDTLALTLPDLAAPGDRTADLQPCRVGHLFAAGTALVPPLDHWHSLRPRDEAGSRALRGVDTVLAAELIDTAWPVDTRPVPEDEQRWLTVQGVRRRIAHQGEPSRHTLPVTAVGALLPAIGHPLLLAGVAGLARHAATLLDRVARYVAQPEASKPTKAQAAEYRPDHGDDQQLSEAVTSVLPNVGGFGGGRDTSGRWWTLNNLRTVTAVLADPPPAQGEGWSTPATVDLLGGVHHHGWLHVLGRLHVLAQGIANPLTVPARRSSLVQLLGHLDKGVLADRGATLREITLRETGPRSTGADPATQRQGQVLRHGDRTVVILGLRNHHQQHGTVEWLAVDHDPSGVFGPVAHFTTTAERDTRERVSTAWTEKFWRLAALYHSIPFDRARAEAFAELTGIGRARATLLLCPPPALLHWSGLNLPDERIAELGLKSAEAVAAKEWLRRHDHEAIMDVWAALLPEDPKVLWTQGPDLAAAAEAWIGHFGRLVTLPEEVHPTVKGTSIEHIKVVLNPGHTPWITGTTRYRLTTDGHSRLAPEDSSAVPGHGDLHQAVQALRWLAYHLPADSPLRPLLPPAAEALRTRLADPELLLDLHLLYTAKGGPMAPVLRAHHGLPAEGGADKDGLVRCGPAIVLSPYSNEVEWVWVRPSGLTGADDPLLALIDGLRGSHWYGSDQLAVAAVLGGELERLAAAASGTVSAAASGTSPQAGAENAPGALWLQNPQHSVPELVAEAARTHGLGEDAAALYLQLLALPDPTDRNVARWTGWKPARLKKARAELAATSLVLEAKRSRAGRSLFLPCGWQEARSPALPVETWKSALYPTSTHQPALPHRSVPELFALAWQRTLDGDVPGYEELQTGKRRKATR
ncbi:hypothetical protein ACIBCA_08845 [Kitasatospora sp. NPDC051170]|uniref:hypothetical protein n=1 Tax=Kitasatospora sp. NPDC051170 TaxID=3364056 RepID=UPI00378AE32E